MLLGIWNEVFKDEDDDDVDEEEESGETLMDYFVYMGVRYSS